MTAVSSKIYTVSILLSVRARPKKGYEMKEATWTTVTETNGITVAEMLAQRLIAADIPAQAVQESAGRAFGFMNGPLGMAYVRVPTQYLVQARELLDVEAPAAADDIVICPECESELEIEDAEWKQGWFLCPVCETQVSLDDLF